MDETSVWIEKLKIYELCARYTLTLDSHDIDGWTQCFTEDGAFGFGDHGLHGREMINAYGQVHKSLASRHLNTSLLFDVDANAERATGQSMVAMEQTRFTALRNSRTGLSSRRSRKRWSAPRHSRKREPRHPNTTLGLRTRAPRIRYQTRN